MCANVFGGMWQRGNWLLKEVSSFLKFAWRPDSDCAATPLRHRDAKKGAKKTLLVCWGTGRCPNEGIKVFLLLFVHKKKCFLACCTNGMTALVHELAHGGV
jgi:hypothetical protein